MNWKKTVNRTIEYVFCGVALIQIIMGIIWGVCQFPHMQNWQETYEYLDVSKTWVMDEYVSFMYPLLIKMCTGIESLLGLPFYVPIYVIQLALAMLSSWCFVRTVLKMNKQKAAWAVGYLVSFPFLLQFHMSVRVESLCVSGLLFLILLLHNLKKMGCASAKDDSVCYIKSLGGAFSLTLLLLWLLPDMFVFCIAVWLLYLWECFLQERKKKKSVGRWSLKRIAIGGIAFGIALALGVSVNGLTQEPGSRGRIQKTFWAAAFQRVVTDYFSRSHAMWPVEVVMTFTVEDAMEQAKRSDNMMYGVGPILEENFGKEQANQMYRRMALDCLRVRTRTVIYQIRDDLADAARMPFSVLWQDDDGRMSQTGWNYGRFRENTAIIAEKYWNFSITGLYLLLLFGLIRWFVSRIKLADLKYILAVAFCQCLWNVLGVGERVSYAKFLLVILFWNMCAVALNLKEQSNRDEALL